MKSLIGIGIFLASILATSSNNADVCRSLASDIRRQLDRSRHCLHKTVLRDCCDSLLANGWKKTSGIYWIVNNQTKGVCDNTLAGGGWLKILANHDKDIKFVYGNTWEMYEKGFGNLNKNFFTGLKILHFMTREKTMQLRVDLKNSTGSYWALYEDFAVGSAETEYKLRIGNYSGGTLPDRFYAHNNGIWRTNDRNWPVPWPNFVGGWWIKDVVNFAPYSRSGAYWYEDGVEYRLDHKFFDVEIRIRSRRYPCVTTST